MTTAIYPGSFDPLTNGHRNIIERGLELFDVLIIAVANNIGKQAIYTTEERMDLIRHVVGSSPNVKIESFDGLLAHYATKHKADAVLRGLRAISDFEYEFQMAHMNKRLAPEIETVFMMTGEEHFYISSSLVREIVQLGGSVTGLVPQVVATSLKKKYGDAP